jgi:polysaccharide deacetylase family protein (PEP-CTERM system associated)
LTVDVEDNFTREELANPDDWDKYEQQVVENTHRVIASLKEIGAGATFFVLGRVAERRPEVVSAIRAAGYEVASHGYAHELVFKMTKEEFEEDIRKAVRCVEEVTQEKVLGFRARSFSISKRTPWAFDILQKSGFIYDSSMKDFEEKDFSSDRQLLELPISTMRFLGKNIALSGGIALRLFPFSLYTALLHRSFSFRKQPIFYFHVWEYNKDQPRRDVGFLQSLFQNSRTYTTPQRLLALSKHYSFVSVKTYLQGIEQSASPR